IILDRNDRLLSTNEKFSTDNKLTPISFEDVQMKTGKGKLVTGDGKILTALGGSSVAFIDKHLKVTKENQFELRKSSNGYFQIVHKNSCLLNKGGEMKMGKCKSENSKLKIYDEDEYNNNKTIKNSMKKFEIEEGEDSEPSDTSSVSDSVSSESSEQGPPTSPPSTVKPIPIQRSNLVMANNTGQSVGYILVPQQPGVIGSPPSQLQRILVNANGTGSSQTPLPSGIIQNEQASETGAPIVSSLSNGVAKEKGNHYPRKKKI
ncbi:hypothetical protein PAEPH01_2928, partial [Pancytospora epiphaga]